jgi:hypothetical protein
MRSKLLAGSSVSCLLWSSGELNVSVVFTFLRAGYSTTRLIPRGPLAFFLNPRLNTLLVHASFVRELPTYMLYMANAVKGRVQVRLITSKYDDLVICVGWPDEEVIAVYCDFLQVCHRL